MKDKKNIILVSPLSGLYDAVYKTIPLALLAVSRNIDREKYNIILIDQKIPGWKNKLNRTLKQDAVLAGITALTGHQLYFGSLIARYMKKKRPGLKIVWGGIHPTSAPIATLNADFVDFVILGEGEVVFPKLVEALASKKDVSIIDGIGHKEGGLVKINPRKEFVNIKKLNDPPYDLINIPDYLDRMDEREFHIESSRGCVFDCSFCYNPVYNKGCWRPRDAKVLYDNMLHLHESFGISNFFIIDDSFLISMKRIKEFIKLMKKSTMQVKWSCEANLAMLNRLDQKTIAELKEIGLNWISIGVESGSGRIRKLLAKQFDVKNLFEFNKRIAKFSINIRYNLMTGTPWEKKADLVKTAKICLKLIRENPHAMIQPIYITVPYPGTNYLKTCKEFGFKEPASFQGWTEFDPMSVGNLLPWFKGRNKKMFEFLMFASFFIDKKLDFHLPNSFYGKSIKLLTTIYRPIAVFRFRHFIYWPFPEGLLIKFINHLHRLSVRREMRL